LVLLAHRDAGPQEGQADSCRAPALLDADHQAAMAGPSEQAKQRFLLRQFY